MSHTQIPKETCHSDMYRYKLSEFRLYIDDVENQQHKIVALVKPVKGNTIEDITRFIENRAETLQWLPNGHMEVPVLKRIPVTYEA